jgi:hypothetical protein
MFSAFTVRTAEASDEPTLAWLATMTAEPALRRPALIGDVDGMPAGAISLADGRVVTDPSARAAGLAAHLRLHRSGWRPLGGPEAARRQLRAALPFMVA